jgi:hypothetical protein
MGQFIIFCFCFYAALLTVTFIYNCINGIRLINLNIDKRKKLVAKSEELIELNFKKIEWLKVNKEDENFEIEVAEIDKNFAEIEKIHKELDILGSEDDKTFHKIDDSNKSIDLFLTILTFGIYRKEEL